MINTLYLPELREMLAERDDAGLCEFCVALHPAQTAEFMEGLEAADAWEVLKHTDVATRAEIFSYFPQEKQVEIIQTADHRELGKLLAELPSDDRVDLLNQVDPQYVQELLSHVPTKVRRDILRLQSFPEGTAGAVMTTDFAKLPESATVRQALDEVSHQAEDLETIYYVYIVDDHDHLRGVVTCRKLVSKLGKPNTPISDLMYRELVTVQVTDTQESMAEKVAKYDLLAIPVVDAEQRLVGIITHDDVIDVMREEATEDAYRLAAVEPLESGYLETHWITLTRKRAVWLVVLFFGCMLTAFALHTYQERLHHPALAWIVLFIPLILSSGGNSGNQSATLVITALTMGDVKIGDWLRVVRRELVMGLALGSVLGGLGFLIALLLTHDPGRAVVVPITLLLVVTCGTMLGSVLPLLFSRMGLDPTLMSNPFVASLSDVIGIIIYVNVALLLLSQ